MSNAVYIVYSNNAWKMKQNFPGMGEALMSWLGHQPRLWFCETGPTGVAKTFLGVESWHGLAGVTGTVMALCTVDRPDISGYIRSCKRKAMHINHLRGRLACRYQRRSIVATRISGVSRAFLFGTKCRGAVYMSPASLARDCRTEFLGCSGVHQQQGGTLYYCSN